MKPDWNTVMPALLAWAASNNEDGFSRRAELWTVPNPDAVLITIFRNGDYCDQVVCEQGNMQPILDMLKEKP